jgi:hypothetical protein
MPLAAVLAAEYAALAWVLRKLGLAVRKVSGPGRRCRVSVGGLRLVSTAAVAAVVGAVASVLAAVISVVAQRSVARLKASLDEEHSESDARRAYEYEALRRLYSVYEPLRIRMLGCADNAVRQIIDMAGRHGRGQATESSPEYRLKATIYYLLAPLVVARMIERRLTLVDFGISERIHTEFVLAQAHLPLDGRRGPRGAAGPRA